ncbi:MAG: hypothetical protein DI535_13585 [Citrobacter freundii]|nr:MAG: hypothetical protein DI535_13585 [Citrobacter freundii]
MIVSKDKPRAKRGTEEKDERNGGAGICTFFSECPDRDADFSVRVIIYFFLKMNVLKMVLTVKQKISPVYFPGILLLQQDWQRCIL